MVSDWERTDELPTEFAERLVDYFRNTSDTSAANIMA